MRPLRYSINITLDGCCHHEAGIPPDEESMRYWAAEMERADALLLGRVTYEMMESAWRKPSTGAWPDWMEEWEVPFAEAIHRARKYVVSSTLSAADWNAELVTGDLGQAVHELKQEPGEGLWVGGVTLPLTLADLGLIDEYEFLVQPVLAGRGPTLLAGLRERILLELVHREAFRSGPSPCATGPYGTRPDEPQRVRTARNGRSPTAHPPRYPSCQGSPRGAQLIAVNRPRRCFGVSISSRIARARSSAEIVDAPPSSRSSTSPPST